MASEAESPLRFGSISYAFKSPRPQGTPPLSRKSSGVAMNKSKGEEAQGPVYKNQQNWPRPSPKAFRPWDSAINNLENTADQFCSDSTNSKSPTRFQLKLSRGQSPKQREGSLPRRRKESVTDLALDTMTTVQEYAMDSPTIPGRPPLQGSSRSLPRISPGNSRLWRESLTPRAMTSVPDFSHNREDDPPLSPRSLPEDDPAIRRRSSMSFPKALKPLVIPANDQLILPAEAYNPSAPSPEEPELPPAVPPKSPRTLYRAAFPQSVKLAPSSANSSTTTLQSICSSVSSISILDDRSPSKPWTSPAQSRTRSPRAVPGTPSGAHSGKTSPSRWSPNEPQESPVRRYRNGYSVDETNNVKPLSSLRFASNQTGHQRGISENSVIHRGRPMKRGDIYLSRKLSRSLKTILSPTEEGFVELPVGLTISSAPYTVPFEELRALKQEAENRVASFEILRETVIAELSQELRILDERCEYLRKTYNSLKDGRQIIHNKMLLYLNTTKNANFSRDSMLKQQEGLRELDAEIDEAMTRLEQAECRRNDIQQKLLQHVSAMLLLKIPGTPLIRNPNDEQTPPRSPEKFDRSFSTERRDVESIRVYADSGVAALLASIEHEIGEMERHDR